MAATPPPSRDDPFPTWLRAQRRRRRHTQVTLAEAVDCSPETIKRIEQGTRRPSDHLAALILDELEAGPEERETLLATVRPRSLPADGATPPDGAPAADGAGDAAAAPEWLAGLEERLATRLVTEQRAFAERLLTALEQEIAHQVAQAVGNAARTPVDPAQAEERRRQNEEEHARTARQREQRRQALQEAWMANELQIRIQESDRRLLEQEQRERERYQAVRRRGGRAAWTYAALVGLMGLCLAAAPEPAMVLTLAFMLPLAVAFGGWPWVELQVLEGRNRGTAVAVLVAAGVIGTALVAAVLLQVRAGLGW